MNYAAGRPRLIGSKYATACRAAERRRRTPNTLHNQTTHIVSHLRNQLKRGRRAFPRLRRVLVWMVRHGEPAVRGPNVSVRGVW